MNSFPPGAPDARRRRDRPLVICAVGAASSAHVMARVSIFAERGHKVFFVTESRSRAGIPGVVEIVPRPPEAGRRSLLTRLGSWMLRRLFSLNPDHLWLALGFIQVVKACRPDVVHVHYGYSFYAWVAGMLACRPLLVSVMGGDVLLDEQGSPTPVGKWLTLNLYRRADFITAKSNFLISELDRLGGFGRKAMRVVWGVRLDRFKPVDANALRERLGIAGSRKVILSPKILRTLYRVHLVVEAMPRILEDYPSAVLLITEYAADPEYKIQIESLARKLGVTDSIMFCGHVSHDEMPQYYCLADVTVAVPSSDGLPQTLFEGMACRVPNILSRLPRYEEIVKHGESAYFVDAEPLAIAEAVSRLLSDEPLRKRITSNAEHIVREQADFENEVSKVEQKYYELTDAAPFRVISIPQLITSAIALYRFRRMQHTQ